MSKGGTQEMMEGRFSERRNTRDVIRTRARDLEEIVLESSTRSSRRRNAQSSWMMMMRLMIVRLKM